MRVSNVEKIKVWSGKKLSKTNIKESKKRWI